jgi:AcrR family transcriptional regulator
MPSDVDDPASLIRQRLWGELPPASRGRPARWTLPSIIEAGIALADEGGLSAVTFTGLAERLGARPMSLYRHVSSKEELLILLEDAAVGPPPPIELSANQWRPALRRWADALQDVFGEHPWLLSVPTQGPPAGPNQLAWLEVELRALRGFELYGAQRIALVTMLSGHVRNASRIVEDTKRSQVVGSSDAEGAGSRWFAFVAERAASGRFPSVAGALGDIAGRPELLVDWDDRTYMLECILDGFAAHAPLSQEGRSG